MAKIRVYLSAEERARRDVLYEKQREEEDTRTYELYRHWGDGGTLLYVGISLSTLNRLLQHRCDSGWYREIVRITIERFPNRRQAQLAEQRAIFLESPKYNTQRPSALPDGIVRDWLVI